MGGRQSKDSTPAMSSQTLTPPTLEDSVEAKTLLQLYPLCLIPQVTQGNIADLSADDKKDLNVLHLHTIKFVKREIEGTQHALLEQKWLLELSGEGTKLSKITGVPPRLQPNTRVAALVLPGQMPQSMSHLMSHLPEEKLKRMEACVVATLYFGCKPLVGQEDDSEPSHSFFIVSIGLLDEYNRLHPAAKEDVQGTSKSDV